MKYEELMEKEELTPLEKNYLDKFHPFWKEEK